MTHLYANNAAGTLVAPITNSQTTLTMSSPPTQFPSPGAGQDFYATITDAATQTLIEIVLVTSVSGNIFTIVRGQDGTSGLSWNAGDIVSQRVVAAELRGFSTTVNGNLINVQTFTSSATYIPTPGATRALVAAIGGGGAGGSIPFTSAAQAVAASGGNAGAYGEIFISSGLTSQTVTIGAGGGPGSQGTFPGGNGGTTSFGSLLLAGGAAGGNGGSSGSPPFLTSVNNTIAGCSGTGVFVVSGKGALGNPGLPINVGFSFGGEGASTLWGAGGTGGASGPGGTSAGFGAGGGGAGQGAGVGVGAAGGAGAPGMCVVYEFS